MKICERCRADEARCWPSGVGLCYGCASALHVFDAEHGFVGQEGSDVQEAGFFCDVPGPVMFGKKAAEAIKGSEAGQTVAKAPGAIEKTATAAGEIAKTVKVVAVIVGVAGVAWVGYALYKARKEAMGLQQNAQQTLFAHPELLRI